MGGDYSGTPLAGSFLRGWFSTVTTADAARHGSDDGSARQPHIPEKRTENAMGINEIDYTIHPYTVGREDCTVLPRSFKTLA
jgi:hypothetical protein